MKACFRRLMMSVAALLLLPNLLVAQSAPCLVEDAAKAAYDEQVAIIESAAVDVESIFTGPGSCINASLLTQFDLSNLIFDPLSMLTTSVTNAITNAINSAQAQVCQAISSKITQTVNDVTASISSHRGSLSSQIQDVLQSGWTL